MPPARFSFCLRFVILGLCAALFCSCSAKAKKVRYQTKADEYFKAGEYDKAEIEYKNIVQLVGLDPWALAQLGIIYFNQGRIISTFSYLLKAIELTPDNLEARLKLGYLYLSMGKPGEARDAAVYILDHDPKHPMAPILLAESTAKVEDVTDAGARLRQLPENASIVTALGILELRIRKPKEAEVLLDRARQMDPKFAPPLSSLGQIYWERKELDKAEQAFAAAAQLSVPRSPYRLQQVQFELRTGKPDAAKQLLDEMIRTTPDFLPGMVVRAEIALSEKKQDDAIVLLERVLGREPLHPDAMLMLARAYSEKGDKDRAVALLEKAAGTFGQSHQVLLQLGNAYLAKGDLERANASFAQAVKNAPGLPAPILSLAQVNIMQRNFAAAITSLQELLKQSPTSGTGYLLLADAYRNQGSFDEAVAIYRKLAEPPNRNPQLSMAIGAILLQQDKKAEAREAFNKAAELAPDFQPPVEQLVNLDLAEKKYDAARTRIEALIAKDPKSARPYFILARVCLAQGENEKAEAALRTTIELNPDAPGAYLLLAQIYIKTNQTDKALTNLQAVVAKNPADTGSAYTLGILQQQKGDFKAARESYEKILAVNPKVVGALNNLAYLLSEKFGDLDKALELAQKARDLSPSQGESADTLGWILYKKRQYARALTLLDDSAEKVPDNAEMQFHLGMAHYMMGQEEAARPILKRALKLNTSFAGNEEARECLSILALDVSQNAGTARPMLEQALTRRKDDPVALARLAAIDEREGHPDQALAAYETALGANASNVNAALNVIRLYRVRNETAKALALANATRTLAPGDGRVAHALGRLAFESGNRASSVGVLQEAARRLSGDPDVLFDLAEASYSVGQVDSAETAWQEALKASPGFPRASLAREYLDLIGAGRSPAQATAALSSIERALKSDASNVPALMAKGLLEEQKNDVKTARQDYEKALVRFPEFAPAMRRLAILYSAQPEDDKKALELANKARESYPTDPELAKANGIIFFRLGNPTRAASLLQDAARMQPGDAVTLYYLGMAQAQLKELPASTRSLKRALELGLTGSMEAEAKKALAPTTK